MASLRSVASLGIDGMCKQKVAAEEGINSNFVIAARVSLAPTAEFPSPTLNYIN